MTVGKNGRDGKSTRLAELLDYNVAPENSHFGSARILHALRAANRARGSPGHVESGRELSGFVQQYEADLVQRFTPLAAVAIQNTQRAVTLEAKMIEAEKKHAIANLVRGVSHDVNNALGCVLPLVQQIMEAIPEGWNRKSSPRIFSKSNNRSSCSRIFGGMLASAEIPARSIFKGICGAPLTARWPSLATGWNDKASGWTSASGDSFRTSKRDRGTWNRCS